MIKVYQIFPADEREKHEAKKEKEQDNIESLEATLEQVRGGSMAARSELDRSKEALNSLLRHVHGLAR